MNYSDIQHRFANCLAGKNGCIKSGNVRYEGRNFYSYSTVFGQWLDEAQKVVCIFDGSTSISSSKHKLWKGLFPDDVHVFPYNDNQGGWYSYDGCDLMGWEREFTFKHRCILIDYYVTKIYKSLAAIKDGKKKGLENVNFDAWKYVEELCSLYNDTSINKYLKWLNKNNQLKSKEEKKEIANKKKLVRLLAAGERNVETLVDSLFGEGTFKKYWDYCARYRKAEDKKQTMIWLCNRLGIANPYESQYWSDSWKARLSVEEVRKLTAKERNEIHFRTLQAHEEFDKKEPRNEKERKNMLNAFKWVTGVDGEFEGCYSNRLKDCKKVINKYTGEEYDLEVRWYNTPYWTNFRITFDYTSFRVAEDKEQWIADFYAKVEDVSKSVKAWNIFNYINAHKVQLGDYSFEKGYVNDDYLRESTTDEEYELCAWFIERQNKYYADEAARKRAQAIERARREEDERKEREYMAHVKQEQIQECVERGADGMRDLWRKHLASVYDAESTANSNGVDDDFFYFGGNVLLRLNLNKDKVETSKHIRIPVEVCKKMWKIVSRWHENPSCFKEMEIDTKGSGKYTISSYQNDILTAGCHKIAFCEMERMYNDIIATEQAA